jgi:hypothetical protein
VLDEREVNAWIARLEAEDSSWSVYERLAILYTIRGRNDQRDTSPSPVMYSAAAVPADKVAQYGDTDFLQAVSGKSPDKLWPIMDELMDSLAITNRRIYDNVMRKIDRI